MFAADFRARARQALSGNWFLAVVAGIIASLLGGSNIDGPSIEFKFEGHSSPHLYIEDIDVATTLHHVHADGLAGWLAANMVGIVISGIVIGLVLFVIGSVVSVGYADFNLKLIDQKSPQFSDLFAHFDRFRTLFCAHFLVNLYTFLWFLLFIIPGIIASYSYAMVPYLLVERPELTASEAILLSKEMMRGNRWRLFCLHISFIGWAILSAFTFGIGSLWLNPYQKAAETAFYRNLSAHFHLYGTLEM